jgi:hypothetical protein
MQNGLQGQRRSDATPFLICTHCVTRLPRRRTCLRTLNASCSVVVRGIAQ